MSAQAVHQLDVGVSLLTLVSWACMMIMLENVTDRRERWVRFASFGPLHQAYDRLPHTWGLLHGVLLVATALWLAAVLVPGSRLRTWLFVAIAGCLMLSITAFALGNPSTEQRMNVDESTQIGTVNRAVSGEKSAIASFEFHRRSIKLAT